MINISENQYKVEKHLFTYCSLKLCSGSIAQFTHKFKHQIKVQIGSITLFLPDAL